MLTWKRFTLPSLLLAATLTLAGCGGSDPVIPEDEIPDIPPPSKSPQGEGPMTPPPN